MLPQIIYLLLFAVSVGYGISKHGEEKLEKYNFWASLLAQIIIMVLLWWGGFFNPIFGVK